LICWTIFDQYKKLVLSSKPNKGDNGVHALLASPFESLAEMSNWLSQELHDDSFGCVLLDAGVLQKTIEAWFKDPRIQVTESDMGSVFDTLEDMDVEDCLQKLVGLDKLRNSDGQ
jgi:hypothetical protein